MKLFYGIIILIFIGTLNLILKFTGVVDLKYKLWKWFRIDLLSESEYKEFINKHDKY